MIKVRRQNRKVYGESVKAFEDGAVASDLSELAVKAGVGEATMKTWFRDWGGDLPRLKRRYRQSQRDAILGGRPRLTSSISTLRPRPCKCTGPGDPCLMCGRAKPGKVAA